MEKVETCIERKRGQNFANDSAHDIDSQTITNSMSSLKTTMKDRLVIVMRSICTNYDAYRFWKTAASNLEMIPMITHTKCVRRHCNTVRVSRTLWTVSITKLGWNTSTCLFVELCDKFMSSISATTPICSKLTTPSKSSGIVVECRTFHPTNCFGKLLPLWTKSHWKQTRWLWLEHPVPVGWQITHSWCSLVLWAEFPTVTHPLLLRGWTAWTCIRFPSTKLWWLPKQ